MVVSRFALTRWVVLALVINGAFVANGAGQIAPKGTGFRADAEKKVSWFAGENTCRGVLFFMARHTGEDTGQLIAYARVNGIVPPWSKPN